MAEVKHPNKHKQLQAERVLQQDTERRQLLLRISALEDTLLAVLAAFRGETKAAPLYQAVLQGMEKSNRTTTNIINQLIR